MSRGQNTQLEKIIDEVLKSGDVRELDVFLQRDLNEGTSLKCSQQFLTKLDKLVQRYLDQKNSKSASLGLIVIHNCGENLKLSGGGQGLSGLIGHGLVNKMVQWFEKCRQLWIHCGPQRDENMFNLSEEFFYTLMVVHEACREGTYKITESFLYPVGQVGIDPRIFILIRKEAIRKFNLILDKIPAELKKDRKILTSQEASDIMIKMAGQISEGGDYDLQTALMEALCRMATPDQRKDLADRWFSMEHVASAFVKIHDSEFETDCRTFLNMVNGMQGDKRRVCSYPCLDVYLDKFELLMPNDEKLEEFWIDFNLGSHSISFYFSLAEEGQEVLWETICITENEVQSYSVTEECKKKVLHIKLREVVVVGAVEGSSLTICFSSALDILQAACNVYGQSKNLGFVKKTGTSVVRTSVKITMEESGSQIVPESQMSICESENTAPYILPATAVPVQTSIPAKMRISESTSVISNNAGGSVCSASSLSAVMPLDTPTKGKHSSCNGSARVGVMKEKNVPLEIDVFPAGQGEEQALEDYFVPDTQPRSPKSIRSSNWSKQSVSERLSVSTLKLNRPEPHLSSLKWQEGTSLAVRATVPDSGPISQKEFHTKLSERLQQVASEQNQGCAPQEPTATQRKTSRIRENAKSRSSEDQLSLMLCDSKVQQAQRKGKTKGQMSKEAHAALNKVPVMALTMKDPQERKPPNIKGDKNSALSSKENRNAAVTQSMVKQISSHYDVKTQPIVKNTTEDVHSILIPPVFNRPIFNMSWLPNAKSNVTGALRLMKSHNKSTSKINKSLRNDVFEFSADSPFHIGEKDKPFANTSAILNSGVDDSSVSHRTTEKKQPLKKKHLFSDTETDHTITEISWLRESNRKPKPKMTKYSRRAPNKPKAVSTHTTYKSSDLTPPCPKSENTNPSEQRKQSMKERVEKPKKAMRPEAEPSRQCAAGRRPKRAAATFPKNYKEPDTDDSQSVSEDPTVPENSSPDHLEDNAKTREVARMNKRSASKTTTKSYIKSESSHLSSHVDSKQPTTSKQQRLENVARETSKYKNNVICVQEQMKPLEDSLAFCQTPVGSSPPFIETMRSAERLASTLDMSCSPLLTPQGFPLPASPESTCQDFPSPVLLLPKLRSTVSSKGNFNSLSNVNAEKKHIISKTHSIQSATSLPSLKRQCPENNAFTAEISPNQQCLSPAPLSPLSLPIQPLMTSTLLELDKPPTPSPQSPFPEDIVHHGSLYGFSMSEISEGSLSQLSTKSVMITSKVEDSQSLSLSVFNETEKTPLSHQDVKPAQILISGPNRKRHISLYSDSEEDEKKEKKKNKMRGLCSPRMKPRKLFHSLSSSHWDAEVRARDVDMDEDLELSEIAINPNYMCQKFSSELKKKSQSRNKMMDVYNKLSLKTVQQHVTSLSMQATKHRTQKLEQVQQVLLDEIHKLEQDDTLFANMEKDLSTYWKKQIVVFRSFQEQEVRRNETLKKALQNNLCHSLEYEQTIFTSQMCLIRKDMKLLQNTVLTEMQEGEIQNMRRGLHALFLPDGARF
ncbi:synaptonemal complex protein 2 isoform X5 [Solea solea]|uniref:synaptonemal complex protein 2 isoform X5 n=1 Tax=Solea solea TaxID=90069 RepID=UPI00272AC3A1|nr:synaptonemal complex protein 2 isoform X5 [Solea solea]